MDIFTIIIIAIWIIALAVSLYVYHRATVKQEVVREKIKVLDRAGEANDFYLDVLLKGKTPSFETVLSVNGYLGGYKDELPYPAYTERW